MAKLHSLRMILALAAVYDWEIDQMEVVTAFLNPKVDGDVYMALPQGLEADKHLVCKLRKSLYGLKQAPHLWYEHIDHFLRSLGLQQCEYDPNVYRTMTDLGPVCCFLGIEIKRDRSRRILPIHQQRTVRKLLVTSRVRLGKHQRHSKDA